MLVIGKEPENVDDEEISFDIAQFVSEKFGNPLSFKSVTGYLMWLNDEYRKLQGVCQIFDLQLNHGQVKCH